MAEIEEKFDQEKIGYTEEQQKKIIADIFRAVTKTVADSAAVNSILTDIKEIHSLLDNIRFDRGIKNNIENTGTYWGRKDIQLLYTADVNQDNLTKLHALVNGVLDKLRGGQSLQLFLMKERLDGKGFDFFTGKMVELQMNANSSDLVLIKNQTVDNVNKLKQIQDLNNRLNNHFIEFRDMLLGYILLKRNNKNQVEFHGEKGYIAEAFGAHLVKHHRTFFDSIVAGNPDVNSFRRDKFDIRESIVFYNEIFKDTTPWWQGGDLPNYIQVKLDKKAIESIEQLKRVATKLTQIVYGHSFLNQKGEKRGTPLMGSNQGNVSSENAIKFFNESFNISSQNQKDNMFGWSKQQIDEKYAEIVKNNTNFKNLPIN